MKLILPSNWCEIALLKMGYTEVFPHVGSETWINTPNGYAPPLVTGTFGGPYSLNTILYLIKIYTRRRFLALPHG